jgi:hypothetical protein
MSVIGIIFFALFFLNAIMNRYLIFNDSRKKEEENNKNAEDSSFFDAFLYFVPFPITKQILKEINEKREKAKHKGTKSTN